MSPIPTVEDLRSRLMLLTYAQVQQLSEVSKAPFTTVWKIRAGETVNPRLETVQAIWPHLPALPAPASNDQEARDAA